MGLELGSGLRAGPVLPRGQLLSFSGDTLSFTIFEGRGREASAGYGAGRLVLAGGFMALGSGGCSSLIAGWARAGVGARAGGGVGDGIGSGRGGTGSETI